MPQIVTCPDCGRKLRVPDNLLGRKVKCPGCGQAFVGEAHEEQDDSLEPAGRRSSVTSRPGESAVRRRDADEDEDDAPKSRRSRDEDDDEDYPVSKRRRDRDDGGAQPTKGDVRQGWERVRFGLNLIIVGAWILVGMVVAGVLGSLALVLFAGFTTASMMSSVASAAGAPPTMQQQQVGNVAGQAAGSAAAGVVGGCVVAGLLLLLILCFHAANLTGLGFCMGIAPTRKTQSLKGLAIAVFCLAVATLLLPWMSSGVSIGLARYGGGCIGVIGELLWFALFVAEFVCFFLFLRGVAVAMRKDSIAQNTVFFMIAAPVYYVVVVASVFILPFLFLGSIFAGMSSGGNGPNAMGNAAGNAAGAGAATLIGGVTCFGVEMLIGLGLFIWYLVLLYQVRGAVAGWLDRN